MISGDNCGKDFKKISVYFRSQFVIARTASGIYQVLNSDHIRTDVMYDTTV